MEKTNFYIFLDIDGVMYDWDYYIQEVKEKRLKKKDLFSHFKPESIYALNLLISELSKKNNVQLVISSTWRSVMSKAVSTLKNNGLIYDKPIERTTLKGLPFYRGRQILDYLYDKTNYDFVIIDDEMFDFKEHFKPQNIIKTEMFHSALSVKMVKEFLSAREHKNQENIISE